MDKYVNCRELRKIMYHQAFETDTPLQRWDSGCWIRYKMFEDVIDSIHAADVRPVVLCRDCKHYEIDNGWCEYFNVDRVFGDYCSEGEKREES